MRTSARSLRGFVSVLVGASAVALAVSGAVLFALPPGWVANRGWSFLGLSKSQWQALHVSFAALALVAGAIHVLINWRPLVGYFQGCDGRRFSFRWEWVLAVAVAVAVAGGAVLEVPPFSSLGAAREAIKDSWRKEQGPGAREAGGPRYGQGLGRMTLEELCAQEGFDLAGALEELGKLGFRGGPQTTLRDAADQLGIRPSEVPDLFGLSGEPVFRGRARGRGPR